MKKYVCPDCGGHFKYWKEYVYNIERPINKITGKMNKKVIKSGESEIDTCGISCTDCSFMYYGNMCSTLDGKSYDYLNQLFDIIAEMKSE
jgi:hypothetical protein